MATVEELRTELADTAENVDDVGVLRGAIRLLRDVPDGDFVWVTPSGREVRIDDLPIETVGEIAQRHLMGWMGLLGFPATNPAAAWDLYAACCKLVAEEPIERPTNAGDFLRFTENLQRRKSDLPTMFEESGLPLEGSDPKTD